MKYLSLLLLLLPFTSHAQYTLTGKIINADDGKPIAKASVFFNNATIGTTSTDDGNFTIRSIDGGQYELIVSAVGFQPFKNTLMITHNLTMDDIKLKPKVVMMDEVMVQIKDPKRARKIRLFKEYFLGRSSFADQCTIVNPEVLKLSFANKEQILRGRSTDFLEIDNNALGYRLRYMVNQFEADKVALNLAYEGYVSFVKKQGTEKQERDWEQNRRSAYFSSPTHFLREIAADNLDKNYMVRSFCVAKVEGKKIFYDTLSLKKFVYKTDKRNVYALKYDGGIDVFYYPPGKAHKLASDGREHGNRGQVANIVFLDDYLYFDTRGTILNPTGALFNYQWSKTRVADLLPSDYWPEEKLMN